MSESAISSQVPPLVNEIVPERYSSARRHVHLFIFCLTEFPAMFSVSAMFPAIPSVARDLHIPENDLTWIINSFNLTASAFLLISGRISDIYTPKYTFTCGLVVSSFLFIGAGFATNAISLISIQAVNGIATSFVVPSILKLLMSMFDEPTAKARAIGWFISFKLISGAFGSIAGAALTQFAHWSWIFWVSAFVAFPTSVVGFFLIHTTEKANGNPNVIQATKWRSLNISGVGIITAALVLFNYAVTSGSQFGWGSVKVLGPLIISIFMLAGFFYYETRIPPSTAAIPPSTWFLPNFSALLGVLVVPYTWEFSINLALSTLWQSIYHWSPISTVLHMLPSTLLIVVMTFTGPLSRIIKTKWILLFAQGMIIIATILLHFADAPDRYFPIVLPALILGAAGCALTQTHASIAIFQTSPSSMAGTIGAIFSGASRLGTVVGLAMASAIQTSVEVKHGGPANFAGRAASFWFLLALACLAVVSLLVFHQNRANENDPSVEEDSGGEKVYQEKSDELVISEVLEV